MQRVLFLCSQPFFQWRGSPIRVGFDVTALAESGCTVDLLTLPIGEDRDIPGVNIIRVANCFFARRIAIGPSLLKAAFDVLILFKALHLIATRRYAVVHTVEDTGPIGVLIARLARARLVFEKHSDPASYQGQSLRNLVMRGYSRAERFAIRHANAVIGTGPGLVNQVRAMDTGKPVFLIPDIPSSRVPADPARTADVRRRLQSSPDNILITYVGSFAAYQGIELLFDAIPKVIAVNPAARFVIIGGTPADIRARTVRLQQQNAAHAVVWAGHIDPDLLPDTLAASDLLLSPRLTGVNTPLKLLDYLKAGRAIVATDTPANRLILNDNTACLTAPDPGAFAAGIIALASDPEKRNNLASKGAVLIQSLYNFNEFKRRLAHCYSQLNPDPSS
jgi:glycosyltransferase involved in cell wall biosynthesis